MSENSRVLTPPGELINVEGRKVHIQRSGTGSPTVVFESGLLSDSFAFAKVQPEIAKFTSTISYDRAGMGYSEPSSNPERVRSIFAKELFELLDTLALSEPLVFIGWSAGGQYIRDFAYDHPERIAGMVLIDSPNADDLEFFPDDIVQIIQQNRINTTDLYSRFSKMNKKEILDEFGNNPPWQNRHPDTHKYYEDVVSPGLFKYFFQLLLSWKKELKEGSKLFKSLGEIPLTVMYAIEESSSDFTEDQNEQSNKIWADLQRDLSELSTNSRLIEVVSGHDIANEKPEIVIEAIRDIVKQVKST